MPVFPYTDPKAVAPTPPLGPTTLAGLASIIVGLVIAVLSLFDVVPTPEDVQQLGVIVGGVLALGAFVVTAVSRTKQANNLAKLAQGERLAVRAENPRVLIGPGGLQASDVAITNVPATASGATHAVTYAAPGADQAYGDAGRTPPPRYADDLLGAPEDPSLEVPGGGPRPDDTFPVSMADDESTGGRLGTEGRLTP